MGSVLAAMPGFWPTTAVGVWGSQQDRGGSAGRHGMFDTMTRFRVQVLLQGGRHTQAEIAEITGMSERNVRRIMEEAPVESAERSPDAARIGRPSKTEPFRDSVEKLLAEEPGLMSLEVLRRLRLSGYRGGKTAVYELVAALRPKKTDFVVRFEGLAGEFSQHDFGTVIVRFMDGTSTRVKFFASRLKYSRKAAVTLTPNEQVETLVRTLADHLQEWGGVPLRCVFDRPKTIALKWRKNGEVTDWNMTFLHAAMELGVAAEVCWPRRPREKGSIEKIVQWVKGSFFKQRRFQDMEDLRTQLAQWLREINEERPSDATGVIPAVRFAEEQPRLRPLRIDPKNLALRFPVVVGPTAHAVFDTNRYALPAEAAGIPGTLFLYRDRVRVNAS
ncbi:MAG: IS21 family transposase [Deltaproteobacteria bacterium]|nr:IS21 family transposase [Deltaproteobacteria bacterium]